MTYIDLRPKRLRGTSDIYLKDKVRVCFPIIQNNQYLQLYIGPDVARKFGLKKGDRVILQVDEFNNFIWRIKKDPAGFKLGDISGNLVVRVLWTGYKLPRSAPAQMKFTKIDVSDGLLQISLTTKDEGDDSE